jgi:hypothetical protein
VQLANLIGTYGVLARVQASGLDQMGGWWSPHPGRGRRHPHLTCTMLADPAAA